MQVSIPSILKPIERRKKEKKKITCFSQSAHAFPASFPSFPPPESRETAAICSRPNSSFQNGQSGDVSKRGEWRQVFVARGFSGGGYEAGGAKHAMSAQGTIAFPLPLRPPDGETQPRVVVSSWYLTLPPTSASWACFVANWCETALVGIPWEFSWGLATDLG